MTGFDSKRQMAADKLQEDLLNYGTSWEKDGERIDPMSVYKEPVTEREALKLALEALEEYHYGEARIILRQALEQPPQREWNAALDHAAARIGEIKGFGKATQDSFAVYIKGLKR